MELTHVKCAFAARLQVFTSSDTLISGVLGPCMADIPTSHDQAQQKDLKMKNSNINYNKKNSNSSEVDAASQRQRNVSPTAIGVGGTNRWCIGSLDETVSFALVFDTATLLRDEQTNNNNNNNMMVDSQAYYYNQPAVPVPPSSPSHALSSSHRHEFRFFQFVLRYVTLSGQHRVRITSIRQPVAPTISDASYFVNHKTFDATAAATIVSRLAISFL